MLKKIILSCSKVTGESLEAYTSTPREVWVKNWPGQCVLAVTAKYWTDYIHAAIRKGGNALQEYLDLNNKQIDDIVAMVRGKLSKQNRTTLQALIVLDVHARDVLANLVSLNITSEFDFNWLSQLRYYWEVCYCTIASHYQVAITFFWLEVIDMNTYVSKSCATKVSSCVVDK